MNFSRPLMLCLLLSSPCALGAELSLRADWWDYGVSGSADRNGDVQDLDADLGVEARENLSYAFSWNTGPGWWPDFAASYTPIDAGGEKVTSGFRFGPIVLVPGATALGDADLKDIDLTLRYPLTLGSAKIWAGVTVKRINGDVVVRDASDTAEDRQRIDQAFPMLHLALNLPLARWFSLGAQGNAVKYGGNEAWEARAGASLGLLDSWGINCGWQGKHYRVADGDYLLDATLSGMIAGIFITLH